MAEIVKLAIKDQVYDLVKERIISGGYKPGDTITILGLSHELGISNTPIREALNVLRAEGLLTASMNNKYRVVELNAERMKRLNETIKVILTGAYKYSHEDGRDANLAKLMKDAYRDQLDKRNKSIQEYIKSTMNFDRCFVQVSGNKDLIGMYDVLNNLLYMSVQYTYWADDESINKNLAEHENLIRLVEEGDEDKVIKAIEEHFNKGYSKDLKQ